MSNLTRDEQRSVDRWQRPSNPPSIFGPLIEDNNLLRGEVERLQAELADRDDTIKQLALALAERGQP